jgi:hypothetical protein
MAKLAAAYRADLDEATLDVYYAVLGQTESDVFNQAMFEAIEDLSWFPTVADLRVRILRIRREQADAMPRLPPPQEDLPIKDLMADLHQKMRWS